MLVMKRLSKYFTRYIVYDEQGYFRYFGSYTLAYALCYQWTIENPDTTLFLHSLLNHKTDVFENGKIIN